MSDQTDFTDALLVGLTPEQREAVMSPARDCCARHCGFGKTHVLTLRIQRRISEKQVEPDQVLAMTFREKRATNCDVVSCAPISVTFAPNLSPPP